MGSLHTELDSSNQNKTPAKENEMTIKKQTKSQSFMDKCNGCVSQNICLSPSSVLSSKRYYLLKITGNYQDQTPRMAAGTEMHAKLLGKIKSLAEYTYPKFQRDFYNGKLIELQELSMCSPTLGYRGSIDRFRIQYNKDDTINVGIYDIKPGYSLRALKQVFIYGMMASDSECRIAYTIRTPRKNRKKRITNRLYPKKPFKLKIELGIDQYLYPNANPFRTTMIDGNIPEDFAQCISFPIKRETDDKRRLHPFGLQYLSNYPLCNYCKKLESHCSLWEICQKYPYIPKSKFNQRYFGKQKLLRKSRPVIKRNI